MQTKPVPTEGQNSTKLEAESALRDAACCASSIPFGTDLTNVVEENSRAADELLATGQFLVDVGHDPIPSERLEEGRPCLWADETMGGTRPPNGDNGSSQARIVSAPLQGGDDVVLIGGGLRSEGGFEGDDNHIDPLLAEVGNFESIHGSVVDSSNSLHNVQSEPAASLPGPQPETTVPEPLGSTPCSASSFSEGTKHILENPYADGVSAEFLKTHTQIQYEDCRQHLDKDTIQRMIESDCVADEYSYDWKNERCCSDCNMSLLSNILHREQVNAEKAPPQHGQDSEPSAPAPLG